MNNQDGALHFESTMDNTKFIGAVEETKKRIQGLSTATVKVTEKIDQAFMVTAENIRIQKDVIAGIESQIKQLNTQIDKTAPGMAQNDLRKQSAALTGELNAEKKALEYLEQQVKETEAAHVSMRTQIRNVREELIQMEMAGKRGTAEYDNLQRKAGELTDAYKDAQQQMSVLANDEKGFRGIVSAVTGVTGAFAAAQGAIGLFAGENENLNRIMVKANSLMAITIGLEQVAKTVNKDSYFQIILLSRAKELLTIAETKLAAAFGISTAAAQALMATLTLGLSAAITGAIVLISRFSSKQKENAEKLKEFNKAVAEAAYEPIVSIEKLSRAWIQLGNDMAAKSKFIKDHAEDFKSLGVNVTNVKTAEDLLVQNKEEFIKAQIAKAKALAAVEMASKLAQEALENEMKLDEARKTPKVMRSVVNPYGQSTTYWEDNPQIKKLEEKQKKLEANLTTFYDKIVDYETKANEELGDLGDKNIDLLVKGSVAAIEEAIKLKKEALSKLTNYDDYRKAEREIEALQARLENITKKRAGLTLSPMTPISATQVQMSDDERKKQEEQLRLQDMINLSSVQYQDITKMTNSELRDHIKYLQDRLTFIKNINTAQADKIKQQIDASTEALKKTDKEAANRNNLEFIDSMSRVLDKIDSSLGGWTKDLGDMVFAMNTLNSSTSSETAKINSKVAIFSILIERMGEFFESLNTKETDTEKLRKTYEAFTTVLQSQIKLLNELTGTEKLEATVTQLGKINAELDKIFSTKKVWTRFDSPGTLADIIGGTDLSDPQTYENLIKLRNQVQDMLDEANSSKKTKKLAGIYQSNLDEIDYLIELYDNKAQLLKQLYEGVLGTTSESISSTIADGFENGLKSVEDFADSTSDIIRKALMKAFQTKFLDQQLQNWFTAFGEAASDGLTKDEAQKNQAALQLIITNSSVAFDQYRKMMEELGVWQANAEDAKSTSLTGTIKGVTEETASILAGQINAIRINQAESMDVVRNQLLQLTRIAENTSFNRLLVNVSSRLDEIAGKLGNDSTRSIGL